MQNSAPHPGNTQINLFLAISDRWKGLKFLSEKSKKKSSEKSKMDETK